MATKLKDYYDKDYVRSLSTKIKDVHPDFQENEFLSMVEPTIETFSFKQRQVLLAEALWQSMGLSYEKSIDVFYKILGPEVEGSLGMFTEGWWLWPIGTFVEIYGYDYFEVSTSFSKELTKRFTGEFCMRPIIEHSPEESLQLLTEWSLDDHQRVRRLASECIRIRLPWAKKMGVALDYFDEYKLVLMNLKDDKDRTIQKSVANNLNDLYKESPDKFEEIINEWQTGKLSESCKWIIKHGSRTKLKLKDKS